MLSKLHASCPVSSLIERPIYHLVTNNNWNIYALENSAAIWRHISRCWETASAPRYSPKTEVENHCEYFS
jgi:hypothetical protein